MTPQRIQRSRAKGWRMPEGAVYVGRPSRWGNPFDWRTFGRTVAVDLYRNALIGHWNPSVLHDRADPIVERAYRLHNEWRARVGGRPIESASWELAGRDLACWCLPDEPCHADALLELANR